MYFSPEIGPASVPLEIDLTALDLRDAVLVRSTNWLGDAVMTLPGVYHFFNAFPTPLKKVVLCAEKLEAFWLSVPWVDDVIAYEDKSLGPETAAKIHAANPGFTAVLPNSFSSVWNLKRLKLPNLFGRRGGFRGKLLTASLPAYRRRGGLDRYHQARHYLEFAACVGSDKWDCDFTPLRANVPQKRADELLPFAESEQILVIAPGAAYGPAKQWPVESFRSVATWWRNHVGPVVCTGAPGERDIGQAVIEGLNGARNLAGESSLYELVYIIERARCVVANDSGTMHLGGALKKDGVAVFGSTDPLATGPIGGRWSIKETELVCRPCLKRECPLQSNAYECLTAISPETVITELETFLK